MQHSVNYAWGNKLKSDKDLILKYLDTLACYWVARAQSDRKNGTICGSTVLDFLYSPINIDKLIPGSVDFVFDKVHQEWSRFAWPPQHSSYITTPLYVRTVFPMLADFKLAEKLSKMQIDDLNSETNDLKSYVDLHVKKYGLPQHLNFNSR